MKPTDIFKYGTFAHFLLVVTKYLSNNKFTLYNVGHLLITIAMAIRISYKNIGSLKASIFGILGHLTLVAYAKNNSVMCKTLFMLSQCGMILIYLYETKYSEKERKKMNEIKLVYVSSFVLLALYYLITSIMVLNISSYGKLAVSILYFLFLQKEL